MIKSDKYHERESERNKRNIRLEEKKTKLTTKGDVSNPDDGSFYVKNQGGENYDLNIKMDNKWRTVPLKTTTSGIRTSEQIQTGGSTNIISSTGTTDTTEIELGLASLRDELEVEKNKLSNTNSDIAVIESDIDDLDVRVIDNTSIITTHTGDITSINNNKEDKIEVIINSNGNNIPPMENVIQEKYPGRTIAVKNSSTGVITEYYYNTSSSGWLPKVSGATNLDALTDVDTTTSTPSTNDVLKWNGTIWVPKPYNYNFTFSIASFSTKKVSDGMVVSNGSAFLIGNDGTTHMGPSSINFFATYSNGPATGAYVSHAGWSSLNLTNNFLGPTTNTSAITYPSISSKTKVFTLNASLNAISSTSTITYNYWNYIYYGVSTNNGVYNEGDIEGLGNVTLSDSKNRDITITSGVGQYIVYALPSRLGTVTFTVGVLTGGFNPPQTVLVQNTNGFSENYYVYRSDNSGLGTITIKVM